MTEHWWSRQKQEGQEENEADTEIHFALFESEMDQDELNLLKMFKKTVKKMTNPGIKFGPWVMVDFDHYLKGNPLVWTKSILFNFLRIFTFA